MRGHTFLNQVHVAFLAYIRTECTLDPVYRQFETFSFLPALTKEQLAKQIDYIVNNGWTPCLEFASVENAYVSSKNCDRVSVSPVSEAPEKEE